MFSTEIAMFASYSHTILLYVGYMKVGDVNCRYQCVKDLCVREEDECCQDRNWVVSQEVCKSA